MTISIWRYSHLALAVSSFLFIALAAVTGAILAFEPVTQKLQPYHTPGFNNITLAEAIPAIKKNYTDITELSVDENDFVIVKGLNTDDEEVTAYVNASTGKQLGIQPKKNDFFQWVTTLHRSLFLHETGRWIIGMNAFLLLLIAISGCILIIKRQRGVKRFFSKVVKDNFFQYYHVLLGRLSLIIIVIIALSGIVLSLNTLGIVEEKKISHTVDFDSLKTSPALPLQEFAVFKNTKLSQVKSIEFPFSEDVEDYFILKLDDREITLNQITGEVLTEIVFSKTTQLSNLSMQLHTGRASAIWAIVLAIASINILFFIWSGFAITLKRKSGHVKNKYKPEESKIILLVGSENGSTFHFARAMHEQLIKAGHTSYITEMNNYRHFPNASHIVVLAATYGLGDAPANATNFTELLEKYSQVNSTQFAVVGFGSHSYPDFCKFAFDINNLLSIQPWANSLLEIHTVNDKSPDEFAAWADLWSQKTGISLNLDTNKFNKPAEKLQPFSLVNKTTANEVDTSFLLQLAAGKKANFQSGDLLAIYPANDHRERQYSIGKVDGKIQLSVKLHSNGLGSGYLNNLQAGAAIKARIISNPHFHFPEKSPAVIMISNGTGIAPFLGMIDSNNSKTNCYLYCGFKNKDGFDLYKKSLEDAVKNKQLYQLQVAYSREQTKEYVSGLIKKEEDKIAALLVSGAVVMLCGSLSMQKDVIALLDEICMAKNGKPVSYYQSHGQVLMDCY